jgi:hypothetical protein
MKKLTRNMSDEKSAAFWASVERTAAAIKDAPAWMKAGVDVNPRHFETYEPQPEPSPQDPEAATLPTQRNRVVGR